MPHLTLLPSRIQVEVRAGTRLTEAIRSAGLPIAAPCGDDLICAKCAVRIVTGEVSRESQIEAEMKRRNRVPHSHRLACALRVHSDLTVTTDYWGQARSDEASPDSLGTTGPQASNDGPQTCERPDRAWILIDHGSRRPEAHEHLESLARELRERRPDRCVLVAHMELAEPDLRQTLAACLERGIRRADLYPLFLAPGRHITFDLPAQIERARAEHPELELRVLPALGSQSDFTAWVLDTLVAAEDTR